MATFTCYNLWKEAQLDGNLTDTPIDFDTDTIKLALATNSYVPAQTHDYFPDASANEVSGTNYTAGGTAVTVTITESSGTVTVDETDVTWSQSGAGFQTPLFYPPPLTRG